MCLPSMTNLVMLSEQAIDEYPDGVNQSYPLLPQCVGMKARGSVEIWPYIDAIMPPGLAIYRLFILV